LLAATPGECLGRRRGIIIDLKWNNPPHPAGAAQSYTNLHSK
jgi:hypothetical protein